MSLLVLLVGAAIHDTPAPRGWSGTRVRGICRKVFQKFLQCSTYRAYGIHQEDPGHMEYPPMLLAVSDLLIRGRLPYILQDTAGLYCRQS